MKQLERLAVIIPALDEEETVGDIVRRCRTAAEGLGATRIVVADNGSRDATRLRALDAGAEVVPVPERGYGNACYQAIESLGYWPDLLVFVDADGSSLPEEIPRLISPILEGRAQLSLGVRRRDAFMTPPQRWGTRLAVRLVNLLWHSSYQDMGPFRGLTLSAYRRLCMTDRTWGWTIEMQIRAVQQGLETVEVPVTWAARAGGASKISGTVAGVLKAGARILWTIARFYLGRP